MGRLNLSMSSSHARFNSFNRKKKGFTPLFLTTKQRYEAGRAGFTLTEVVVAALIIAVLAAGVASVYWGSQYFLNRARHRMQAYNFAVEALDKLRSNYQYSSSPAMAIGADLLDTQIDAGGILRGDIAALGGTLKYDVTEPEADGYKQVTIKVHWNEPTFKE